MSFSVALNLILFHDPLHIAHRLFNSLLDELQTSDMSIGVALTLKLFHDPLHFAQRLLNSLLDEL